MSKDTKKVVKTESDLQKLIEDTRKLRKAVKPVYNPNGFVILNGMEIANYRNSGFPTFKDIKLVLEECLHKYKPVSIVVDSSLRYLLPEDEVPDYEQSLQTGIQIRNIIVPIIEVGTYEDAVIKLLKLALDNNAKVLCNQDLVETYEIIKQKKIPNAFKGKKFQLSYEIQKSGEIAIFE